MVCVERSEEREMRSTDSSKERAQVSIRLCGGAEYRAYFTPLQLPQSQRRCLRRFIFAMSEASHENVLSTPSISITKELLKKLDSIAPYIKVYLPTS